MSASEKKNIESRLLAVIRPPLIYEHYIYDKEDVLDTGVVEILQQMPSEARKPVLDQADIFVKVRQEIGLFFLLNAPKVLQSVPLNQLPAWTISALDLYDVQGMNAAKEYIAQLENHPHFSSFGSEGLKLANAAPILENYAKGLAGREIKIGPADFCYTDTETIYLPENLNVFTNEDDNFLLFKLMVTHKWAQIAFRTYRLDFTLLRDGLLNDLESYFGTKLQPEDPPIDAFISLFPERELAMDLFNLAETVRLETKIRHELEGLGRDMRRIKAILPATASAVEDHSPQSLAVLSLERWLLTDEVGFSNNEVISEAVETAVEYLRSLGNLEAAVEDTAFVTASIYRLLETLPGPYQKPHPLVYQGILRPNEAETTLLRRRESNKQEFQGFLDRLLEKLPDINEVKVEIPLEEDGDQGKRNGRRDPVSQWTPDELLLDGQAVPMPEAMRKVIQEILEDVGYIPSSYLMSGAEDMSGHHFRPLVQVSEDQDEIRPVSDQSVFVYDEWDYRRNDYRKNWCEMRESLVEAGEEDFVNRTLSERHGMVSKVRRQFEMLRLENRVLRRQKEGEEIDLDAVVEAFSDMQAGIAPSERLLVRRQRDQRSIAAGFLIDMSGSTKGWINQAIKEALVVMSEALEILGDRYAIYGFSGMTRKRCELYRVKAFSEAYNDEVKGRVAGIQPRDYTRIGPPIRHMTNLLSEVEARVRLLVTLSDGKPDDYDGYKGDYAIEDTRQALIEAKQQGIHPFCITIDKAAHSYISHMYGRVNFIFLKNVEELPFRLVEIYRRLTT
jgi:nitric oxide reductase NorD protein